MLIEHLNLNIQHTIYLTGQNYVNALIADNYLLSQTASNYEDIPEVKDGFFTTYYAFNRIVLDVLMEKFDIQVDDDTITQSVLLHSDIPGYDLPAINFVSPLEEAQESYILKEEDSTIHTHLEKVLVHMIDEQDAQIFKSHNDYVQNKKKISSVFKICRNMAIRIIYLLIHSFSL